ncbi:MAG: MurR/RpiR family transcriptional regulator [Oscillospiraceae bacterium]
MAGSILHTIEGKMSGFSKGQRRIAAYILENYDTAAFMTAGKLGKAVAVSESTVVRFATELGFDGYPGMQKALQEMVRSKLTSIQRIKASSDQLSGQDILPYVIHMEIENIRRASAALKQESFDRVVEKILQARHIYILGVRSSSFLAGYMNFYFNKFFANVTLVQSNVAGAIYEQLMRLGKDDILICICYPRYSKEAISAAQFAVARGAEVVAVTDSEHSPLYALSAASLLVENEMISFVDSIVAPMCVVNALIVALSSRMGTDVSNTFAELEKIWEQFGVYNQLGDE